jgi:hypothetical protein
LYLSEYVNNRIRHVEAKSKLISTIAETDYRTEWKL